MNQDPNAQPLVSVVLCTFNGALFLREQLRSILAQTYQPVEVIVSDDASTDDTQKILQEFEHQPRFRIFYQPVNLGYIRNFDFALRKASGAYIALCDQDDVWLPHKLEVLVQHMGSCWLTYSNSLLVNEQGLSMGKTFNLLRNMTPCPDTKGFFLYNVVWGHTVMVNRELLHAALPIPAGIPHDVWLAYKAATLTGIHYCNEVLTHYRQHAHTCSKTLQPRQVPTRSCAQRYISFRKQLHWLEMLTQHAQEQERAFYTTLLRLFAAKGSGKFNFRLFFFLCKHQQALYRFSRKGVLSRLVDIRKLSRGERTA